MHAGLGFIDLIHAENGFIEVGNFMAIADLFLGVKIDGAVVDAKFVALEEWHSHLLLIKNHNLLQQVSTLNLTRMPVGHAGMGILVEGCIVQKKPYFFGGVLLNACAPKNAATIPATAMK